MPFLYILYILIKKILKLLYLGLNRERAEISRARAINIDLISQNILSSGSKIGVKIQGPPGPLEQKIIGAKQKIRGQGHHMLFFKIFIYQSRKK